MRPWQELGQEQRVEVLRERWPSVDWARAHWVETGWDFLIACADDRIWRMPRTHSAAWRLLREMWLLARLTHSPVPVPRYREEAPGLYGYPMLKGVGLSSKNPPSLEVRRQVADFIRWLHDHHAADAPASARVHWRRKVTGRFRRMARDVMPLLSVKDARRLAGHFDGAERSLAADGWRLALLHGDLAPEHVLVETGQLTGVLDFGDWRWGDAAFDWCGILGLDDLYDEAPQDEGARARIGAYRLAAICEGIRYAIKIGDVETASLQIRLLRRLL